MCAAPMPATPLRPPPLLLLLPPSLLRVLPAAARDLPALELLARVRAPRVQPPTLVPLVPGQVLALAPVQARQEPRVGTRAPRQRLLSLPLPLRLPLLLAPPPPQPGLRRLDLQVGRVSHVVALAYPCPTRLSCDRGFFGCRGQLVVVFSGVPHLTKLLTALGCPCR